jgi:hypothetical protein
MGTCVFTARAQGNGEITRSKEQRQMEEEEGPVNDGLT